MLQQDICSKPEKKKYVRPVKDERFSTRVLHLRLKDKHDAWLGALSREVNTVWNFCNEHSFKVLQREHRFCSAFDMHPYLAGAAKEGLTLHSQTVQAITEEFVTRRKQFKKAKLRWRCSYGVRRSMGWIPFKSSAITYKAGQIHLAGKPLSLWDSFGLADYELGAGNISQDARGRWYLNITVKALRWPCNQDTSKDLRPDGQLRTVIGIDLGLKDFLAASDGTKVTAQRIYRGAELKLATAQRANKTKRVQAIHAQIANRRKDFLHKLSTRIVKDCSAVFVGNVNASGLARTTMAKSVLDAGWSAFRTMLMYKSDNAGVWFNIVEESYSTQECSSCHARTGPKGLVGLDVRSWTCSYCNTEHDRDTNSAINIENRGLEWLDKEISAMLASQKMAADAVNKENSKGAESEAGHGLPLVGIPLLTA